MNPLLRFLRSPQGRALAQHAIEAAGQHILEAVTKAGTAGRVERCVHHFQVHHDKRQQLQDNIKEAKVLDVHVGETYKSPTKYDSTSDPEAP